MTKITEERLRELRRSITALTQAYFNWGANNTAANERVVENAQVKLDDELLRLRAADGLGEVQRLLIDAEWFLCDKRAGAAANEVASRIRSALHPRASKAEEAVCETCGGTSGFVINRGTLDVCDDPFHEDEPKQPSEPTDSETREVVDGLREILNATQYAHVERRRQLNAAIALLSRPAASSEVTNTPTKAPL